MTKNNSEKGAAVVEFAFVFLILLVIVFGIIEFGFLWLQSYYIANAAREGARVAAVLPNPTTTPDLDQVQATIREYLTGLYPDARVNGAGGCCGSGDFIEVAVADGDPIVVPGTGNDVETIKVTVTVQTAEIWRPVLWDLLRVLPLISSVDIPDDINEISEFAVFAKQN